MLRLLVVSIVFLLPMTVKHLFECQMIKHFDF
jgi:hypothetical protein